MPLRYPADPMTQAPPDSRSWTTVDVLDEIIQWRAAGRGVALATVIATWGSSPRPPGSQLVVDHEGRMAGSVSGGCVEGSVVETALGVIESGVHEVLDFGVTDEMAWEVGLACGGEMQVFIERVVRPGGEEEQCEAWLDGLRADCAAKRPVVLTVNLATGRRELLHPTPAGQNTPPELIEIATATRDALRSDTPRMLERADGRLFLQPFNPPLRLVIVGAVHIAQPLSRIARESGYEVIIVDPRGAFASDARFPGTRLERTWPDEALQGLGLDGRTAIVTLTHDPKLDDPALHVALRSPAFYIGSLGSRRTQARRLERLREEGFDDETLGRIHGPVGLDIGARSPAEIAISILGEITARLRGRTA